ncbi:hypothetical protein EXIGLDRAFT_708933 [Exidia glandulosa HHB12029]|uniref:Uncharacterized protein n=1 Tax=Exidia glandulosa HHB12029 TaxID=1314781 RepID=A0A165Z1T2_EXIGL|nr:hypothetical protein EXIGLDRAFT_708933 [Exidia glandulosa HHB12029]
MPALLVVVLLTLAVSLSTSAKFTTPGCWQRNCLVQNDAGTLCLQPAFNALSRRCNDTVLTRLLDVHIHSKVGRSTAYYKEDGSFLGSTVWPIPTTPLPYTVFVCMSGRRMDDSNAYRTLCRLALHDDDIDNALVHDRECAVEVPQDFVSDGCYTTPPASAAGNPLDKPALVHALFVLDGIVNIFTIITILYCMRKPLRDGWRYIVAGRWRRRILGFLPNIHRRTHRERPHLELPEGPTVPPPASISTIAATRRTSHRGSQAEDLE